jgi:hypothetical protein
VRVHRKPVALFRGAHKRAFFEPRPGTLRLFCPLPGCGVGSNFLLAVLNSDVFSYFLKKFIAHTWMAQISDLRMMPLVMPTRTQASRLERLAELALATKRHQFAGQSPAHELSAEVRAIGEELFAKAPCYLRPFAPTPSANCSPRPRIVSPSANSR